MENPLLVPPKDDTESQIADIVSQLAEMDISADMKQLIARGLHNSQLPTPLKSNKAAKAFQHAFEMIGGVTRLAVWADRNPDKFYAIFGRMIHNTAQDLAPNSDAKAKMDDPFPWVTAERLSAQASIEVAADIKRAK